MAKAFLKKGLNLCISASNEAGVLKSLKLLESSTGRGKVVGTKANVTNYSDIENLYEYAKSNL